MEVIQMKNFSTWMLVIFMAMFWVLRVIVAVSYELGGSFAGIVPYNSTLEIVLLFVVLLCMILVVKRKVIGGLIYLIAYGMYFGTSAVNGIMTIVNGNIDLVASAGGSTYLNLLLSIVGLILPIAVVLDLLLDKNRKLNPKDKKTDWFYTNEAYDRKLDDRADKNNYRTL